MSAGDLTRGFKREDAGWVSLAVMDPVAVAVVAAVVSFVSAI
jgi:hypothetical protein